MPRPSRKQQLEALEKRHNEIFKPVIVFADTKSKTALEGNPKTDPVKRSFKTKIDLEEFCRQQKETVIIDGIIHNIGDAIMQQIFSSLSTDTIRNILQEDPLEDTIDELRNTIHGKIYETSAQAGLLAEE